MIMFPEIFRSLFQIERGSGRRRLARRRDPAKEQAAGTASVVRRETLGRDADGASKSNTALNKEGAS